MLAIKQVATVAILGLSFSLLSTESVYAISFNFTKIADTSTPIPGSTATFTEFQAPSISGNNVAFLGRGSGFQEGIYISLENELDKVADNSTSIPGSSDSFFFNFSDPSISGSNVAFSGTVDGGSRTGIYLSANRALKVVADFNTPIPNGNGNFTSFNPPDLSGDSVAFLGSDGEGRSGIYIDDGTQLTTIADFNTPIPGGTGNFTGFLSRGLSESGVAFLGVDRNFQSGIYTNIGGSLAVVADRNTLDPASAANFTDFFTAPALSGDNVAFGGISVGYDGAGIYTKVGSQLNVVATNSLDRGVTEFINFLSIPSISGSNTAFLTGFGSAIYTDVGGSFARLIGRNDTLNGKTLASVDFSSNSNGLSGDSLAFLARFSDGSQGIFRADLSQPPQPEPVPEPTTVLGLLLVGVLGATKASRR
ncbi:MAG: PEP-CTERM sorting domain-containing protein [Leptolyngbyaceae cyanobacterium RM2_2_4]|nr:PEP-CTERM sorting domain-containing protein [Leptolyngbyaceae cyanobacterium SM1_4_3]NJN58337.1 PEP-CTERM sorting domain-containing protein [Leptolyngbyaceae cyanobacterium SL_5_9]NJO50678.1 PEP-CTERM sorting domain-containing protein [Leptolyngbyaceae cyanobacterium RM2_2_4]